MVHAEFSTFTFLLVLTMAYPAALFFSWALHFIQHQKILDVPLYFPHWRDHHLQTDDPDEWRKRLTSGPRTSHTEFWVSIAGHGLWFLLSFGVVLLYFVMFTPWIATTLSAVLLATGAWHWYLHQMSHRASGDCWLARFQWFERERDFHRIHHLTSSDFSNARNFAFGDPFSKHVMDYLFGTLVEATGAPPHHGAPTGLGRGAVQR